MWSDQFDANLQVAGVPDSWVDIVMRGDPSAGAFIGFVLGTGYFRRDRGQSATGHAIGPSDDDSGKSYTADDLADEAVSMRELSKR